LIVFLPLQSSELRNVQRETEPIVFRYPTELAHFPPFFLFYERQRSIKHPWIYKQRESSSFLFNFHNVSSDFILDPRHLLEAGKRKEINSPEQKKKKKLSVYYLLPIYLRCSDRVPLPAVFRGTLFSSHPDTKPSLFLVVLFTGLAFYKMYVLAQIRNN